MWSINTALPISYDIKIANNLFSINNSLILDYGSKGPDQRRLVVVDSSVLKYYQRLLDNYFNHHKVEFTIVSLEGGESNKSLDNLIYLLKEIEKFGLSRKNEPIIGIGGGVILDLVGLAANLYRRGVPYIRVPTTLLGIVDVSIAAKTGINFEDRRNRLGSYYPPVVSILDKSFIKTTEDIEISSGLGEVLKMGVIKDAHLYNILEKHGKNLFTSKFDCEFADETIERSIQGMKEELENNLWEKDLKRCVDFGHSFSPIIEMRSLVDDSVMTLTHGQAVTLDVIFSSIISYNRNLLSLAEMESIVKTARAMNLPTFHTSFTKPPLLLESLNDTTKHRNGDQNLPIPVKIGEYTFLNDLTYEDICEAVTLFEKVNAK